jgi:hypothetical protein
VVKGGGGGGGGEGGHSGHIRRGGAKGGRGGGGVGKEGPREEVLAKRYFLLKTKKFCFEESRLSHPSHTTQPSEPAL